MNRYEVLVRGPRQDHIMAVFAGSWDDAAQAAINKIQDKIERHGNSDWGPIAGPWRVIRITWEDGA